MLCDDDGEQGLSQRIGLALQHAETVAPAIRIMRCKNYKTTFSQSHGEGLVITMRLARRIPVDDIGRHAFQSVLTNDGGTTLTGFHPIWHQQIAPRRNV